MMTANMNRIALNDIDLAAVNGGAVSTTRHAVGKYYTIQRGDTLIKIAHSFHTTVEQLVKWNGIKNPRLIITGHKLRVRA